MSQEKPREWNTGFKITDIEINIPISYYADVKIDDEWVQLECVDMRVYDRALKEIQVLRENWEYIKKAAKAQGFMFAHDVAVETLAEAQKIRSGE